METRRRRKNKSNSKKRSLILADPSLFGEKTNVHHRLPRADGGSSVTKNLSRVSIKEHQAFNILFNDGHMPVSSMALKLSKIWIDPHFMMLGFLKKTGCNVCGKCIIRCYQEA